MLALCMLNLIALLAIKAFKGFFSFYTFVYIKNSSTLFPYFFSLFLYFAPFPVVRFGSIVC